MNRNQKYILAAMTLLALLLSACDTGKIKIGEVRMMYGTNQDGLISYDVSTFTGIEEGSFKAERGQAIAFDYDVNVNKGSLIIKWQDPEGEVVWGKDLVDSEAGHDDIPVDVSGEFNILVQGKGFGGSFDVTWKIK